MATKELIFLNEISKLESNEERWNPFSWYKDMRDHHPVYFDENERVWNVFRYQDVKQVLTNNSLFSNERERSLIPIPIDDGISLIFSDPPEHRKRRGLLSKAFTPRSLQSWKPRIQSVVDQLVQDIAAEDLTNPIDIMEKFAVPLPVTIIADLLGVPNEDWSMIKKWSDILFMPNHKEGLEETTLLKQKTIREFSDYLLPLVKNKRNNPVDDILSDLTQAEYEGERLSDSQIASTGIGLLGAGNETTTTWLTLGFYCLITEGVYSDLRKETALIPQALEEVLRYRFNVSLDRKVKEDTEIFGKPMKKGDLVVVWSSSANRDERHFQHPDRFDIHRSNVLDHLSFGSGQHFCLGAPLARLEAQIAMTSFVRHFSGIGLAPDFRPENHLIPHGASLTSLPILIQR